MISAFVWTLKCLYKKDRHGSKACKNLYDLLNPKPEEEQQIANQCSTYNIKFNILMWHLAVGSNPGLHDYALNMDAILIEAD